MKLDQKSNVLILTGIFLVSIKSFDTLESFNNNGHIYMEEEEENKNSQHLAGWAKSSLHVFKICENFINLS